MFVRVSSASSTGLKPGNTCENGGAALPAFLPSRIFCVPTAYEFGSPFSSWYLSRRASMPTATFSGPTGDVGKGRTMSRLAVPSRKRTAPAEKEVGDVAPSDVLALFSRLNSKELPPYPPLRSQFQSLKTPFAPSDADASLISLAICGRNPFG